ncbi:mucin-20 isoform X2 [Hyaena hyaena]|uniref:mucin-20 isoform X2 n=1 Tax=Hyaena hyaena TaxID=95912 RepID=UPI0019207F97|nr:mucin-20 isoform X2 [Hyaena hyaena]
MCFLPTGSYSQPQSLCCLGIDHHCKRGSCYCDEFCHVVLDCYPDHYALCNPASQNTKMVLRMVLRMENPPPETCKKQSRLDAAPETKAFTKTVSSKLMVVITTPTEASATRGSPMGTGMITVETVTGTDLVESVLDTLCTDDNSEEARRIVNDILTLAHTFAEAKALALESSAVSNSSVLAIATSQTLASDAAALAKALLAYTITDTKVINCSVIEIETTTTTPGTLDIGHDPTGAKALSPSEMSALLDSTESESDSLETMTSAETLSGATEPAMPDTTVETPLPSNSTIEGGTAAAKTTSPSTTLVTVSTNPLEETSALSVETSHTESSVTISTRAGSTVGKVTSPAGLSSMAYSHTQVATSRNPIPSETSTTDSTTNGSTPISRSPFPPVHLTVANSSPEANITLVKTLARTLKTASMTGGNLPTAMPTTAQTKWATEVTAGGDGGFFLLRLSVASPEDLTDPRVVERLMQQLFHELCTLMPPIQVSLLRVKRD